MAIDVFTEEVVSINEAAKRLPKLRAGKPIGLATIYRWINSGRRSKNGDRVRLESIKIGGAVCTSTEALQRFFDRLTTEQILVTPPSWTVRQRLKRLEKAERELDELLK